MDMLRVVMVTLELYVGEGSAGNASGGLRECLCVRDYGEEINVRDAIECKRASEIKCYQSFYYKKLHSSIVPSKKLKTLTTLKKRYHRIILIFITQILKGSPILYYLGIKINKYYFVPQ